MQSQQENEHSPHIVLSLADVIPDQLVDKFKTEISGEDLRLNIGKFPFGGPYMSLEWAIPTFIGVYILKPYFDSFLKEAGKDHYELLKAWLKKNGNETRSINFHTVAATQSTEKIRPENTQSKAFSIETITKHGGHIKFLFDTTLPESRWDEAIDSALQLLHDHFSDGDDDALSIIIQSKATPKSLFAVIDLQQNEWQFMDSMDLYRKHLQERSNDSSEQ